jgi:SAM-dependent methyltransferase
VTEVWHARARSFGARAAQYDDARPGYPEQLVDEILAFGDHGSGSRALEVGAGTGKATRRFLARGLQVTALEPGVEMIETARESTSGPVEFVATTFEDWPLEEGAFDLLFAAQSFHWVDQEAGYAKAGRALRPGGTLALFWNRPAPTSGAVDERLAAVHAERGAGGEELSPGVLVQVELSIAASIESTGLFEAPERASVHWSRRLTTQQYVTLLETYSANAVLPDEQRAWLLSGISEVVDEAGGEIDVHYDTVAHLARRV